MLRRIARAHGLRVFVETGTYRGDTLAAMAPRVDRAYSIEIEPRLAGDARARFARRGSVVVLEGDSAVLLRTVLSGVDEPALFWLDGHWSGGDTGAGELDSPVRAELDAILDHPVDRHVVLVDDARFFPGANDTRRESGTGFPSYDELVGTVRARRPGWSIDVVDDVIRIVPGPGA